MRLARFALPFFFLFLNTSVWGQQASTTAVQTSGIAPQQMTPSPTPSRDPQAVTILNQVLSVAGGSTAIAAITDYIGTGTITYQWPVAVQGSVTIRGSGLGSFRLDANLPTGTHSLAILNGQVVEKTEQGSVDNVYPQPPMLPARFGLPFLSVAPMLASAGYSLTYKGTVEIDGRSVHDIEVRRIMPQPIDPNSWFAKYLTIDFFIEPSTSQIVMVQDVVNRTHSRRVRYSNYRLANGLSVPTTIREEVDGQPMLSIQIDKISFSTGLQDSDFQL